MIYNSPDHWFKKKEIQRREAFLTFRSPDTFSISVANPGWDGTIEYSTDAVSWTTWDGSSISSISNGTKHYLYLSGTGNTVITGSNNSGIEWTITGSNVSCIGDIDTLLDYETVQSAAIPTMGDYCYDNMFYGCTALITAPNLPARTLTMYCYAGMFRGCTNLSKAPSLPAEETAYSCYTAMFYGCKALTKAPELPATLVNPSSYNSMFRDCTSLIAPPDILATWVGELGCAYMFYGCTSLIKAPSLTATSLGKSAYRYMFYGCTSLSYAPALPATNFQGSHVYNYMFSMCTNLKGIPALPSKELEDSCYSCMFDGCTGIKLSESETDEYTQPYKIPSIGYGSVGTSSYPLASMFRGTGGTFTGTPSINKTYYLSSANTIV